MKWDRWDISSRILYQWNEFDGSGSMEGILTEKYEDHAIVKAEDLTLWLDESNADMFNLVK